jgi:uncharacterized protein YyaL (SSP411 family)
MNRLADETSPYLLQHADNPVDWFPWGEEAFRKAEAEDKPILLSVGYSACHWCHVMAHESFENPEIAALMNAHFVPVKVDREERPDVDAVYMSAVQTMTGAGGWPMTVALTPEGKPFFGGTYYPPDDRLGHPGFRRVLTSLADAWKTRRGEVDEAAQTLTGQLGAVQLPAGEGELDGSLAADALTTLNGTFDAAHGGFGAAPKFPPHTGLEFLLLRPEPRALELATTTLDKMAQGGIYDQLGGGFARYSVDAHWLVPHFEKMLYDNAQLVSCYAEAYAHTQKPLYKKVVEDTLAFAARELRSPEGGFYSALDADSEGEEGKYYVWRESELDALLGEDAELAKAHFGVTPEGNFEGHSILFVAEPVEVLAERFLLSQEDVVARLERAKKILFEARQPRVRPGLDDKVLCSWNGLMLGALADAGRVLGREDYLETARETARFMQGVFYRDGRLLHTYKAGQARIAGMLEDYSLFALGLLALYRASLEAEWLLLALELTETVVGEFHDPASGGFFSTVAGGDLIVRPKDLFDSAIPSGNGAAALLLAALSRYTDNRAWEALALDTIRPLQEAMRRYPTGFASLLVALERLYAPPQEIAIFGDRDDPKTQALLKVLKAAPLPHTALALIGTEDAPLIERLPFTQGRGMVDGKATVYVCAGGACRLPVTTPEGLRDQLEA